MMITRLGSTKTSAKTFVGGENFSIRGMVSVLLSPQWVTLHDFYVSSDAAYGAILNGFIMNGLWVNGLPFSIPWQLSTKSCSQWLLQLHYGTKDGPQNELSSALTTWLSLVFCIQVPQRIRT